MPAANPASVYHLPDGLSADLAKLRGMIEGLKAKRVPPADLRAFLAPLGVYEQREADTYMLRVRLPAGIVLPHQMRALAKAARRHGNGALHVTTRQDVQVHRVPLDSIHPALIELLAASLSTKGGGGNTVRNVTACPDAGVCPGEAFDVSPYAIAVTEFLLPDPLSHQLPRKFKIAFSGCGRDCAGTAVNDAGFAARRRGEEIGFAVYVAGGMGARSRVGGLLEEFIPAGEACLVAEAVKRVFDKHGNRKDRHKARLRFLVERIGHERFRELYEAELSDLKRSLPRAPEIRETPRRERAAAEPGPAAELDEGFLTWRRRNTSSQKQPGFFLVHVPLFLGDIPADALEKLADVVEAQGEGLARATQQQNFVLRWVRETELPIVHSKLREIALAETPAPVLRNIIACAGASTCKLGICLSRGLARAVIEKIERQVAALDELGDLKIHISGCPNACGRHPLASVGLFGVALRHEGKLVPHYVAQIGGSAGGGRTRLAEGKTAVPARNVPAFIAEFLEAFRKSREYPDFQAFVEADGREIARSIAEKHKGIPPFDEDKNSYYDWGAADLFSLAGRGPGECGAPGSST